jgi:hypothetical protein
MMGEREIFSGTCLFKDLARVEIGYLVNSHQSRIAPATVNWLAPLSSQVVLCKLSEESLGYAPRFDKGL